MNELLRKGTFYGGITMSENKKSFSVTGMTCITCANTVENSLKKLRE